MGIDIFQVAQSGLLAAQVGISTTGQNISNASSAGYSRQQVQQTAATAQGYTFGYVGQGTQISTITRDYNSLLSQQISSIQSASSQISTHSAQITPIDNVVADSTAGLSPALQTFFTSLQNLSSNPSAVASRQTAISGAQTLVARFQSLQTQLDQSRQGVNTQIGTEVESINTDAQQLAQVNSAIQKAVGTANGQPPNDLLDQRDLLVANLSKETQVTVVPQGNQYNIFIGNGQPLVLGGTYNTLETVPSASNPDNVSLAYNVGGKAVPIADNSLPGGNLGGLLAFRSQSLDPLQSSLGRVAIGLATSMNAQNALGQDLNGNMGSNLFTVASPLVNPNSNNTGTAKVTAAITDVSAVTTSDYQLKYDGTNYTVTRMSDNTVQSSTTTLPATVDGVSFNLASGAMASGDSFVVRPTYTGATGFGMATTDPAKIAAAAPIVTAAPSTNTGTGAISAGSVSAGFAQASVTPPISLAYNAGNLTGFPSGSTVVTTDSAGQSTTYAGYVPGTPVALTTGMTVSFSGISVGFTGTPATGDAFTIGANTNGSGDNRNALLMNALQTKNTLAGGTTTFQGAYAQLVNQVGNTTGELTTTGTTQTNLLAQATASQQSISGVNLDEETVNLLQYQQAYQASGKLIQMADQLFTTILNLHQ